MSTTLRMANIFREEKVLFSTFHMSTFRGQTGLVDRLVKMHAI